MTVQEASYYTVNELRKIYPEGEAMSISDWVMEHLTGSKKAERMLYKTTPLTADEEIRLKEYCKRLARQEPVQYVLQEAWFCGMRFYVDNRVLIPRPETEELVEWIISNCKFPVEELQILDIGTGSGCIPIALKRRLRKATVWSCDNSSGALEVARKNAAALGVPIQFLELDILDQSQWHRLPLFDIIVSNPPYIPESDKDLLAPNVLLHEPASALFVPAGKPLLFYTSIAEFGKTHLKNKGALFFEIHEDQGESVTTMLRAAGYQTEIRKDMQQKDRMVKSGLS